MANTLTTKVCRKSEVIAVIGLLTPFSLFNYGTKLQAYAVQQTISNYGATEVIDYRPSLFNKLIHKPETMKNSRYLDFSPTTTDQKVDTALLAARQSAIARFNDRLTLSKPLCNLPSLSRHARNYECTVCGSDQIWSPVNLSRHVFMLEFAPRGVRKVAFSPSFGIESLPDSLKPTYRRRIANLDHISVREESGLAILSDLGFDDARHTLDPTLVLNAEDWERIAEPPSQSSMPPEPYLFCYFLGNRSLPRQVARQVARQKGLSIVNLPHFKGYVTADAGLADADLYDVSVENFLWLLRHASAVCTDSFHGTAFAIQFGKDLYYCPRHEQASLSATNGRAISLLARLGLEGRAAYSLDDVAAMADAPIDYKHVWRLLDDLRSSTASYLDKSLEGLG